MLNFALMARRGSVLACCWALACVADRGRLTNQMAQSATRYLARAAHEPVSWQSWSRETFALAARLDRPILLYIGADDCRSCVVMDRESYADPELGELIDSLFIPVRVDRDERPDIAQRYQVAVQVLVGVGGYPLTVFLTPDGSAFFGGTYFPADDPVTGRGMKQILPEVARSFRSARPFIMRQAALVRQLALKRLGGAHGVLEPGAVASGIARVRNALARALGRGASLGTVAYSQAAALVLAAAARGDDSSDTRLARAVLDVVTDSGDALLRPEERDEEPEVVRAGMLRNLAVGWALTAEPRYRTAARRLLDALGPDIEVLGRRVLFADRAGYVIGSMLEAAAAVGDSSAEQGALAALDAVLGRGYRRGRGVRHSLAPVAGMARGPNRQLLQDQVQVAGACLAAYDATGKRRYLAAAEDLAAILERDFADPLGGYFDASGADPAAPLLTDLTKEIWDDLLPGANAWAARVLIGLADATGDEAYRRRAEATLEAFAGMAPADDVRASSYLAAAQLIVPPRY